MQPHTGAVITVIHNIVPDLQEFVKNGKSLDAVLGKEFHVYSNRRLDGRPYGRDKHHAIKFTRYNSKNRELEFDAGVDYTCYMIIRHDSSFSEFEITKHRHTHIREKFTMYPSSSNFRGDYTDESGRNHSITGNKSSSNRKFVTMIDVFKSLKSSGSFSMRHEFTIK